MTPAQRQKAERLTLSTLQRLAALPGMDTGTLATCARRMAAIVRRQARAALGTAKRRAVG
ncbi:MAG: hypothetical protein Q8S73_36790 [Deltaproteobacteria bacterium]|nr:hypothetical protein [Myxococcales bacterium]MDP3219717.1 hypothetical protein [Deltaproteobacteria bacterium]